MPQCLCQHIAAKSKHGSRQQCGSLIMGNVERQQIGRIPTRYQREEQGEIVCHDQPEQGMQWQADNKVEGVQGMEQQAGTTGIIDLCGIEGVVSFQQCPLQPPHIPHILPAINAIARHTGCKLQRKRPC